MTAKRKPKTQATVKMRTAVCKLFCTSEMRCPLCGVIVPPSTPHLCSIGDAK